MSKVLFRALVAKIILVVVIWSPSHAAEVSAPLGLAWGASQEEVRALGVDLQATTNKDYGESYSAHKLPKALSDQEDAVLSFGYDNKLWRIAAISRKFESEPQGTTVRTRYQELLTSLTEKYGKPQSVHSLGNSIFSQPAYFVAGINNGKSFWYSNLGTADVKVQLGIRGETSDAARWVIFYENVALKKAFQESKRVKEKGSL